MGNLSYKNSEFEVLSFGITFAVSWPHQNNGILKLEDNGILYGSRVVKELERNNSDLNYWGNLELFSKKTSPNFCSDGMNVS